MTYDVGDARIRIPQRITKGDIITVHSIVSHPMDTGLFRTTDGQPIPKYLIEEVVVRYGEEEVARFEWTSGISRDPVVTFCLRADREAPLTMVWKDNKGAIFQQSVNVAFAIA